MPKLSFSSTACHVWEMQVPMDDATETLPWPQGGIILQNVTHDDYNFAKDIRVARIWVFGHDGEQEIAEDFKLFWKNDQINTPDAQFELIDFRLRSDHKNIRAAEAQVKPNAIFSRYAPIGFIVAKYKVLHKPDSYFFKEGDPTMYIEQRVLFTDYGRNPPHEPGAVLDAARKFPLVTFFTSNPKVLRVRVDYRMNISLDVFLREEAHSGMPIVMRTIDRPSGLDGFQLAPQFETAAWSVRSVMEQILGRIPTSEELEKLKKRPNQVGIFRDEEHLPGTTGIVEQKRGDLLDDLFFAGEKPVPWEIYSLGLNSGFPGANPQMTTETNNSYPEAPSKPKVELFSFAPITWDNIHFWGGFNWRGTGSQLPSSPGAFHAAHLHWRWGRVTGYQSLYDASQLAVLGYAAFGEEQFKGYQGIMNSDFDIGGPLIDPKIPSQAIHFAVTTQGVNSEKSRQPKDFPSEREFGNLFSPDSSLPEDLLKGSDIVLWLSFAVKNKGKRSGFGGTFFIHGMYFAHNLEPLGLAPAKDTVGEELYQYDSGRLQYEKGEDVPQKWRRYANGRME